MAWLLRTRKDEQRYQPKLIPTPECVSHKIKTAYRNRHGFSPSGIFAEGNAVEDRFWPGSGKFRDQVAMIPPILGLCSFYLIPNAWREAIEEFEPGVHQFKHIPLTLKDGSPLAERYYAMNIRQALYDVADREKSTAHIKNFPGRSNVFLGVSSSYNERVYFFSSKLKGFHLWWPAEINTYNIAVSNKLFDRISQLGGVDTIQTLEIEEV